jgi:hypothetical protein
LVHDQVRGVLRQWQGRLSRVAPVDWSSVDRELLAWFGRPALEADLPQLISGVHHTVRVGKRSYDVSVTAHLRERIGGLTGEDAYPLTVNARAQQVTQVTGRAGSTGGTSVAGSSYIDVHVKNWVDFRVGGVRLTGGFDHGSQHQFLGESKSTQHSETSGLADEHVYDVVYEVSVRAAGQPAQRWWIHRPSGELTAHVVVPHQYVPQTPLSERDVALAGLVIPLEQAPETPAVAFRDNGAGGVSRSFLVAPSLPAEVARMYQQGNRLPESWLQNPADWPAGLRDVFSPTE